VGWADLSCLLSAFNTDFCIGSVCEFIRKEQAVLAFY